MEGKERYGMLSTNRKRETAKTMTLTTKGMVGAWLGDICRWLAGTGDRFPYVPDTVPYMGYGKSRGKGGARSKGTRE